MSNCADVVAAVRSIQPGAAPQHLLEMGIKNRDEFDANQYFTVLEHVAIRQGYILDYVYVRESLGGSPLLFARPENQAPYASMAHIPANTQLPDFREYLQVEDVEQGYFEYIVLSIMANLFYLDWHALYNVQRSCAIMTISMPLLLILATEVLVAHLIFRDKSKPAR